MGKRVTDPMKALGSRITALRTSLDTPDTLMLREALTGHVPRETTVALIANGLVQRYGTAIAENMADEIGRAIHMIARETRE